ncbi:DNA-directed RNA polymerase III 31 kDa polypeptide [Tenacibaculum sp. 190130A14a]|uniref:Lipoprotein n=1 Tax=Tenacibaculum polynesiense TaxID=3137857 RepID=A0ABM9PFN9_9FLAO
MKKLILVLAILFTCGIFTSCTDLSNDLVPNETEQELPSTGGNEQDPDPDPDDEPEDDYDDDYDDDSDEDTSRKG